LTPVKARRRGIGQGEAERQGRFGMRRFLTVILLVAAGPGAAQDPASGADLYIRYCAACHGMEARGDGEMAAILTLLPADLTQISAGNGGIFPVARVAAQIDGRDPMLAHGGVMPLFGDFFEGQDTAIRSETGQPMLTSRPVADLLAFLAAIQE
jgi:mono/diheme cytochrome c family protein